MTEERRGMRRAQPGEAAAEAYSRQHIHTCVCDGAGFVRLNVPVGHELFGKAIPCVCRRDASLRARAAYLRAHSGLGLLASTMTFATFDLARARIPAGPGEEQARKALATCKRACQAYAKAPYGWIMLSGTYGSGKTHLATAIANEALRRDMPVYVATVPEMLDALRARVKENTFEPWLNMLMQAELLVLDDLGQEDTTPWAGEQLFKILNFRHRNNLPLVLTTNLALPEVAKTYGGAVASRLTDGAEIEGGFSRVMVLPAGDFRPQRKGERCLP